MVVLITLPIGVADPRFPEEETTCSPLAQDNSSACSPSVAKSFAGSLSRRDFGGKVKPRMRTRQIGCIVAAHAHFPASESSYR